MPEDEQSQGGLSGAVKRTKEPAKPAKAKSSAREERLAAALRENLRRRKAPKQQQDAEED